MAVSKRLRFEVLRRDGYTCRYCGRSAPDVPLTVDHVIPVALGGGDEPSNLVTACGDCNSGKTSIQPDSPIVADVAADALRWKQAMDRVVEVRKQERAEKAAIGRWFTQRWDTWRDSRDQPIHLPSQAIDSVVEFVNAGLDYEQIDELLTVAMRSTASEKWRYFCGCAWRRIRENTDMAKEMLDAG